MRRLLTVAIFGLTVLATVWVYNRFSGKSIAQLGAKS
jgi:hypothetical protein